MSDYTDARTQPGNVPGGTDDRQLFLTEFGEMVLEAYEEIMDYNDLETVRNITQGKADSFPIIGRKRDATDHVPGELILGGTVENDEVVISLDKMLVDSIFVAEIDELMAHYELRGPYARQLGQSLASTNAKRIAQTHILASRTQTALVSGIPVPAYFWDANLKTDAEKLEAFAFAGRQYLLENDMSGSMPVLKVPHQQFLLLSRYSGMETFPGQSQAVAQEPLGNRAAGTMGQMAGLSVAGSNHIPKTDITTGLSKYQGDFSLTVGHISNAMACGTLNRRGLKVVIKEQDERIGTIMIASQFNGHGILRAECAIEGRTAAIGGDPRTALTA